MGDYGILPIFAGLIAVALIVLWLLNRSNKGARRFQAGSVTGITGRKGHGKTLLLVHECLRHIGRWHFCKKCHKNTEIKSGPNAGLKPRDVFGAVKVKGLWCHRGTVATNMTLELADDLLPYWVHVTSWDDLAEWDEDDNGNLTVREKLPHCTFVAIDEMHMWSPAKNGEVLPVRLRVYTSQLRKIMQELDYATQNIANVSAGLRRQTDEVGVCRRGLWGRMKVRFYDPEDLSKSGSASRNGNGPECLWVYKYKVTPRLAAAYDTFELIVPAEVFDAPRGGVPAQRVPALRGSYRSPASAATDADPATISN